MEKAIEFGIDGDVLTAIRNYIVSGAQPKQDIVDLINFFMPARSYTELRWHGEGKLYLEAYFQKQIVFWGYEWISFKMPGGYYTPDYFYLLETGQWAIVEAKFDKKQPGYRATRDKLRAIATLNPWAIFLEVRGHKGEDWIIDHIKPDVGYLENLMRRVK